MNYHIRREENWNTIVEVTIPADRVAPEIDSAFEDYQRNLKLEGFRKGKIPPELVKKMFGKHIESRIYRPFIAEAWKKIRDENEFRMISEPDIREIAFDDETGLTFQIHFAVQPVFQVTGFQDMPVEKPVFKITEKDIDAEVEELRARNAMIHTVEGGAGEGHFLIADLQELDRSGLPVIGRKYPDRQLRLTAENGELLEQLKGVKAGEERKVFLREDGRSDAGNAPSGQYFAVRVKEVKERRLPVLDDEFAKDLGDFSSMNELRNALSNSIEAQSAYRSRMLFHNALADELIKRMDIGVPAPMLDRYLDAIVTDIRRERKGAVDEEEIRQSYRSSAIRNIKWHLICERLIEQQDLRVGDEELDHHIAEIEKEEPDGPKRAQELRSNSERRKKLRDALQESKIYDFLSRRARVTEVKRPWRRQDDLTG